MECRYLENQICIRTDGQYRLCCLSNETSNSENINTHTPIQWLNSDTVLTAKKMLSDGIWPDACKKCEMKESHNLPSKRLDTVQLGPGITHLDLRFGNTCNLGCVMCNPGSSSTILHEHEKLIKLNIDSPWGSNSYKVNNWYEEKSAAMLANLPNLKEVYLTGGEPMMVKNLSNFLNQLAATVKVRFNTNGTILNKNVLQQLEKFEKVDMCFSIDGVGKVNDYIRWGSSWDDIERNIDTILSMPNVDVSIGPTIQILNAYYYDDLIIWAQERNLKIYENILVTPFHYNIKNADNRIKERIPHLKDYSGSTIDLLEKEKFIKYTKILDNSRGCSLQQYLPEVAEIYDFN